MILVGMKIGEEDGYTVEKISQESPEYSSKLSEMSFSVQQWLSQRGIIIDATQWGSSFDPGAVMGAVGSTLASFGNVMTNAVMIILTVIFILAENVSFGDKLRRARGGQS